MLPESLKKNEKGTAGLPIRIVVLSIVGFIGFCAILSAISDAPKPPEPMYATSDLSTFSLGSGEEKANFNVRISVLDRKSLGVGGANVIVWSPDRKKAYSGITDSNGNVIIAISDAELPPGKVEGYISIKVMRSGYTDYDEKYFIKIKRN